MDSKFSKVNLCSFLYRLSLPPDCSMYMMPWKLHSEFGLSPGKQYAVVMLRAGNRQCASIVNNWLGRTDFKVIRNDPLPSNQQLGKQETNAVGL